MVHWMLTAGCSLGLVPEMLDTLEDQLKSRPFVCGDEFSAAALHAGSQIGWAMRLKTIEARPSFTGYWSRLTERPVLGRSNTLNDALLPKG